MDDCCNVAGGRVSVTANGQRWSARSSVSVMPTNFTRAAESNQDGSLYVTVKPRPYKATIALSDKCGMRIEDIMDCKLDVTIELIDIKRIYYFTRAVVVGDPEINTETGEIRGIEIVSDLMRYENLN